MDSSDGLAIRDLVFGLENFLRTPPNSWPIVSKMENSLSYRIGEYLFHVEFIDSLSYTLETSNDEDEKSKLLNIPYLQKNLPDWKKLFEFNISQARNSTDRK